MERKEIIEKVNEFLIDDFEIDEEKLTEDARLKEDVGIDSLDYVDIVVVVNKVFGFKIQSGELKDVKTLGQFYSYIEGKV
ncbi:MAG: acyl carrier protein [Bacteroidaceae bacterium]|nr:acyl carrier protein [Bacteroidaceae bacterium]